jgi:predicted alpha/beta hydrolase
MTHASIATARALPARNGAGPGASDALPSDTTLLCDDGRVLAASWFEPPRGAARAVAVVHSATGVPRHFYRGFAQWLAARGYAVLTYDYRGIGQSRQGDVRRETASMADWAVLDMSAALAGAQARRERGALPLLLVGHSFGGNALGFARGVEHADAILGVAAQSGEWRLWPQPQRWVTALFFYGLIPAVVRLFGHAPAWALGGGAQPLPPEVARTWARWGRRRGFSFSDPAMHAQRAFGAVVAPVHLWHIEDDLTYGPAACVDALAAQFRQAAVQRHALRLADTGLARIGHFGAFRRELGARIWPRLLQPIEQAAPALRDAGLSPAL